MEKFELDNLSVKTYLKYISISIVLFWTFTNLFPFYYETGSESHFKIINNGIFSGNPQGIFYSFGVHILISDWMAYFYKVCPNVNWYDVTISTLYGILIGQITFLLGNKFSLNSIPAKLIVISIFAFLVQNIIRLDPLRISLLLSSSSMMLILNYKLSSILRLWVYLMFVIGLLIRIESGVLAVLFITIAELVYKGYSRKLISKFSLFYIFLCFILVFINFPTDEEDKQYLKIRPFQFALWDYYNTYPEVTFESKRDSVIFNSSVYAFMADEGNINEDFFKRVGLNTTDKKPSDFINYIIKIPYQLDRLNTYFAQFVLEQKLLWVCLFIIIMITNFLFRRYVPNVLMIGSVLFVMLAIAVLMKMEHRLFFSLVSILVILIYFYGNKTKGFERAHISLGFSVIAVSISILYLILSTSQYVKCYSAYTQSIYRLKQEIAKLPASSIVFLDLATTIHWYSYMFEEEVSIDCNVLPLDNGLIYITKSHQEKLKSIFDCNEFHCYMDRFLSMEDAYYVAVPERKMIIENYMEAVYDTHIDFKSKSTIVENKEMEVPPISVYMVSKK